MATYAGAHMLASIPNALFASQAYGSLLADDVIDGASPLPYRDGRLAVPVGPGLRDPGRGAGRRVRRRLPGGPQWIPPFRDMLLEVTPVMPKF